MTQAVAYMRVSTREQGKSGLGLEAQRATIERIAQQEGYCVVEWYTEVQSGKGGFHDALTKRPTLAAALKHADRLGGTVLVAKLDRLSRNVHFISGLMAQAVEFRCCDLPPEAPKFMLHIFAVLAEWERDRIGERTRDGLAAAKARGQRLGSPTPRAGARVSADRRRAAAAVQAQPVLHAAGVGTWRERAERLNAAGYRTARGNLWNSSNLCRLTRRTLPSASGA